jgi:endonuclease-3 related protein
MQESEQQGATHGEILRRFYLKLLESLGPQDWWPAKTRLEIILGAILTQNTTWRNATLALQNLRRADRLSWTALERAPRRELEAWVRPAGFYRQKARTISLFAAWLNRTYGGSLDALFRRPPGEVRRQLLALKGIGSETADAILLYAGRHPFFVADAYTRRVLSRHRLFPQSADYDFAQRYLHQHLEPDQAMFNEFHALLVEAGKRYCRREIAQCEECPLGEFLPRQEAQAMTRKPKPEIRNSGEFRVWNFEFRSSGQLA